jgi:hypothetical protein
VKRIAIRKSLVIWNVSVLSLILLLFSLSIFITKRIELSHRLSTFDGVLIPANDPFVPACGGATGNEAILLYKTMAVKFDTWPSTLLSVNGKNRITMNRDDLQNISISAQVFSGDGKVVTGIVNNIFRINRNNVFTKDRPDESTLVVTDQNGDEALYMRYLNKREIELRAKLYYPDAGPIDILDRVQNLCIVKEGSNAGAIFGVTTR